MDKITADRILEKIKKDYEAIAQAFTDSRTDLWEEREYFGEYLRDNVSVLDMGCANGRLLKLFEKHKVSYTGVDNSPSMLLHAEKFSAEFPNITSSFINADMIDLPFEN
ncbi:class I SAM-dependent methyltransferase, partial [Patescibacteria group bacterium]